MKWKTQLGSSASPQPPRRSPPAAPSSKRRRKARFKLRDRVEKVVRTSQNDPFYEEKGKVVKIDYYEEKGGVYNVKVQFRRARVSCKARTTLDPSISSRNGKGMCMCMVRAGA